MQINKNIKNPVFFVLLLVIAYTSFADRVIYVDDDATGLNDGSSWENAYTYLQDALADANDSVKHALSLSNGPVEIRVAQGIYKPDRGAKQTPGDRSAAFQLINNVTITGGYAGIGAPDSNTRDIELYKTILSGDLNSDDVEVADPCGLLNEPTRYENSYHVVTGNLTDLTAILDGFIITGGNANGPIVIPPISESNYDYSQTLVQNDTPIDINDLSFSRGGGIYNDYGSPKIVNCILRDNSVSDCGAGIYNISSDLTINDCRFENNYAQHNGGGIYNYESNPNITYCTFNGNIVDWEGGGISNRWRSNPIVKNCIFIYNYAKSGAGTENNQSNPTFTECIFGRNTAERAGGGMANYSSNPVLAGCEFIGNQAFTYGGGIYNWQSNPIMEYCVFSGNSTTDGGGIHAYLNSNPTLINCTFVRNLGENGRALSCKSSANKNNIKLANCILWDGDNEISNPDGSQITIDYTNIRGGLSSVDDPCNAVIWGEGNIDEDPLFADPGYWADVSDPNIVVEPDDPNAVWIEGDYHLKSQTGRWDPNSRSWVIDDVTSPCIDAGDPNSPIGDEPFPNGGIINMGAYGGTTEASKSYFGGPPCETIIAGDINGDCKVDLKDFTLFANNWLKDKQK